MTIKSDYIIYFCKKKIIFSLKKKIDISLKERKIYLFLNVEYFIYAYN